MKNLFLKSKIKSILDDKVTSGEIKFFNINKSSIHIKSSKRSKFTLDISGISDELLIRLLFKKIPNTSIINTNDFFRKEISQLLKK